MAEGEDTRAGGFSLNKFFVAVILFIAIGFISDKITSYTQLSATQDKIDERAVVGDDIQKTVKENNDMLKQVIDKLNNLENKSNLPANTSKPTK